MTTEIDKNLLHLSNLNDITTQINRKKTQFAKYVYDNYIKDKSSDSYSDFVNKIFKKRRPMTLEEDKISEEESVKQCEYIIWNKGKLRQCLNLKADGDTVCIKHHGIENSLFEYYLRKKD